MLEQQKLAVENAYKAKSQGKQNQVVEEEVILLDPTQDSDFGQVTKAGSRKQDKK